MLRPGMFAVVIFISPGARRRAVVPAAAILRLHDKDWVFKPDGPKRFRRVEVQAGAMSPDKFQAIAAGVAPGDEVVANALQLNSTVEQQ